MTSQAPVRRSPAVTASSALLSALAVEKAAEERFCATCDAWGETGYSPAMRGPSDAAGEAHKAAVRALMATVPATAADLLVLIDRFETITDGSMIDDEADGLTELLATVRAFVSGRG